MTPDPALSHAPHTGGAGNRLKPVLSTLQLWGIAVGPAILGEYFGWDFGWASACTLNFTVTMQFMAALYVCFIFSFTELTTSISQMSGTFAYSKRAFGPIGGGYLAGAATLIKFVFAPPAISLAIGAYLNVQFSSVDPKVAAVGAYDVLMAVNIVGVGIAATFELVITVISIFKLLMFMGVVLPGFSMANFNKGGWSGQDSFGLVSIPGIFAAIPFTIWFFLAIECVAMAADEAKDHKCRIPIAYTIGILTLVLLAVGVMLFAEHIKIGGQTLTANVVTMAMFAAILTYIMSILSLFKLRRSEPATERPFIAPFFQCSRRLRCWPPACA